MYRSGKGRNYAKMKTPSSGSSHTKFTKSSEKGASPLESSHEDESDVASSDDDASETELDLREKEELSGKRAYRKAEKRSISFAAHYPEESTKSPASSTDQSIPEDERATANTNHVFTESQDALQAYIGADAPPASSGTVEEAFDDVEFPEAVVLIGKMQWRCVTCMVHYSRSTSIDSHLRACHTEQTPPPISIPSRASRRRRGGRGHARGMTRGRMKLQRKAQVVTKPATGVMRRGQGTRRGRARRSKGSRSRGRGRGYLRNGGRRLHVSEPSDTEVEETPLLPRSSRRCRTRSSSEACPDDSGVPAKIPKLEETAATQVHNDSFKTPLPYLPDAEKESLKRKYLVLLEKADGADFAESETAAAEVEPPPPIEMPSLQADALLPPATPLLPEIPGPPETPLPPETPHPPESYHPLETSGKPEVLMQADSQDGTTAVVLSETAHTSNAPLLLETKKLPSESSVNSSASHPNKAHGIPGNCHDLDGDLSLSGDTGKYRDISESCGESQDEKGCNAFISCITCHASFGTAAELKAHHSEVSRYEHVLCRFCEGKFHGVHQLNMHVFSIHEKDSKKFCFVCGMDCMDSFELEEHLLEHSLEEQEKERELDDFESISHTCKVCGADLEGNVSDLMNHYHTIHDQFVCTTCFECFLDMTTYQDHKLTHMADASESSEPVVYVCPVSDCFQICEDKEMLRDHISWHEDQDLDEDVALLLCSHCPGQFRNKTSLHRHLAELHHKPDIKPFVCELCNDEFGQGLELHHHNTVCHAGIKRYGCAYCTQRFAFRSSYRRHVASQHDIASTILRM